MNREYYEQRFFRIFAQAGYSPVRILTVTPEEMVKIPGITVPNIRTVLCIQRKVLSAPECVRQKYEDGLLLRLSEETQKGDENE